MPCDSLTCISTEHDLNAHMQPIGKGTAQMDHDNDIQATPWLSHLKQYEGPAWPVPSEIT